MASAPPHAAFRDPPADKEEGNPYVRMTPMELDIQLQAAELIFRSILEGKRLAIHASDDVDTWHRDVLGEAWVQENKRQRKVIAKQMKVAGENTPEWIEALSNMSDIAWEVLEDGGRGERLRKLKEVNRVEVLEQFKELHPKVRDSYYARCGAGDRLYGLRACIAIFRTFIRDPEILDYCAACLKLIISDHEYNRDGLCELSLPMPPNERSDDFVDCGWSFLRAALDAFIVQGGGEAFGSDIKEEEEKPEEEETEDTEAKHAPPTDHAPKRAVAVKLAECIVAAKSAPALTAQLGLLRDPLPANPTRDRKELKAMLPASYKMTKELNNQEPSAALAELLEMLQQAGADSGQPSAPGEGGGDGGGSGGPGSDPLAPPPALLDESDESKRGVLKGLADGVRGLWGRGSSH